MQSRSVDASGAMRSRGAIAQLMLQLNRPRAETLAKVDTAEPFVAWLRQLVLLLADEAAAARWFADSTAGFKAYSGRQIGQFRYGEVTALPLSGIGDEVDLMEAPNAQGPVQFHDTYVNVRRSRVFVSVSTSSLGAIDVRDQLRDLAERVVARLDAVLADHRG